MTEQRAGQSTSDVSTDLRSSDQVLMLLFALVPMIIALVWHISRGGAG